MLLPFNGAQKKRNGTFYSSIYLPSGQGISCHFYFSRARYGFSREHAAVRYPKPHSPVYASRISSFPIICSNILPFYARVFKRHLPFNFSKQHWWVLLFFYVLLTVHLSIILVINQINAQNLFYNKFIICLYMFRALCAYRQEVKIVLYNIWYHHTCRWPSHAQVESAVNLFTGRPPTVVTIPDAV